MDIFGGQKTCPQLKVAAYGNALCKQRVQLCFVKATIRRTIGFQVFVKGASTVTVIRYLPRYLTEPNPCWVQEYLPSDQTSGKEKTLLKHKKLGSKQTHLIVLTCIPQRPLDKKSSMNIKPRFRAKTAIVQGI